MDNQLTLQDIAIILAEQTGKSVHDSVRFLQLLLQVVADGLCEEKHVHIKGLGTFQLEYNCATESINDDGTGKPRHGATCNRFVFSPDKDLKALVNHPFSMFEAIEINANVNFPDLQTIDWLPGQSAAEDISVEEWASEPIRAHKEKEESDKMHPVEQEETLQPAEQPPASTNIPTTSTGLDADSQPAPRRKYTYAIFVTLLLALGLSCYIALRNKGAMAFSPANPEETIVADTTNPAVCIPKDTLKAVDDTLAFSTPSSNDLDTITIRPGDRLTSIALRYYGHKFFWVYIYEYNKEKIADPNNVPIGTSLRLPAAEKYGINANDRTSIENAAAKQTEILSNLKPS